MAILSLISGLLKPVSKIVDDLHTSVEEKLLIKKELAEIQAKFATAALEYETKLFSERSQNIRAETKSESRVTRTWRPITMLTFLAILVWFVVGKAFGGTLPDEAFVNNIFGLIKLGLGGYIIGRSAEKVVPQVIGALKKKELV